MNKFQMFLGGILAKIRRKLPYFLLQSLLKNYQKVEDSSHILCLQIHFLPAAVRRYMLMVARIYWMYWIFTLWFFVCYYSGHVL